MRNRSQDCIQACVEIPLHILGEEAEDEETVFLKPAVFAPVASVGDGVGRVLRTIEFHGDPKSAAEHVDFCASTRRLFRTPPALSDSGRSVQQPSRTSPVCASYRYDDRDQKGRQRYRSRHRSEMETGRFEFLAGTGVESCCPIP
jgi:hypothetical protein